MKTSVAVIAIKAFDHKGQSYQPQQSLSLSVLDAVALSKRHLVTLTKRHPSKAVPEPPAPEPVAEPKQKRAYKRRDMQAETTADVAPVQVGQPEPPADEPIKPDLSRWYARRTDE